MTRSSAAVAGSNAEVTQQKKRQLEPVAREYTIHLSKYVKSVPFKRRAKRAIDVIRKFAQKTMFTKEVRINPQVNRAVWSRGIRYVPTRIRVVISRLHNNEENAKEKFYSTVGYVPTADFHGLKTVIAEETA